MIIVVFLIQYGWLNDHLYLVLLINVEIRDVGVGYYSFDVDEERRQEQMKTLNKLREDVSFIKI